MRRVINKLLDLGEVVDKLSVINIDGMVSRIVVESTRENVFDEMVRAIDGRVDDNVDALGTRVARGSLDDISVIVYMARIPT